MDERIILPKKWVLQSEKLPSCPASFSLCNDLRVFVFYCLLCSDENINSITNKNNGILLNKNREKTCLISGKKKRHTTICDSNVIRNLYSI